MTTIAYDGVCVAADSRRCAGWEIVDDNATKVVVRHGRIYAQSGLGGMLDPLVEWHHSGADPKCVPSSSGSDGWGLLVVEIVDGRPVATYRCNEAPWPVAVPPPWSQGSGGNYATGAMCAGRTAAEAVAIAARRDIATGGRITEINIAEALGLEHRQAAE